MNTDNVYKRVSEIRFNGSKLICPARNKAIKIWDIKGIDESKYITTVKEGEKINFSTYNLSQDGSRIVFASISDTGEQIMHIMEKPSVVELKCNHQFHTNCINKWLQNNKTCPLCNTEIDSKIAKK